MTRVKVHITVFYRTGHGPQPLKFVADHERYEPGEVVPGFPNAAYGSTVVPPSSVSYKCDGRWIEVRHNGGVEFFPASRVVRVEVREQQLP